MCFPNQINMYIADREIPWEYVWIEFDGLRAKETIELTGLSPDQPVYKARYKDLAETMKSEMLYIVEHKEESPFHLIGHLYLFIDSLVRSCSLTQLSRGNSLRDFYIREAVSFIEQNFQNAISVEDIAASCGLNRSSNMCMGSRQDSGGMSTVRRRVSRLPSPDPNDPVLYSMNG